MGKTLIFEGIKRDLRGLKGELRALIKNSLGTFSAPIQVLPKCQVSEKLDEGARRYFRTHVRESLGLQRLRRETKKATNSCCSVRRTT